MADAARQLPRLLTVAEAAEILAVSPKHLRREFIETGILAVIRLGKGAKGDRIDPADIDSLVRLRTVRGVICNTDAVKRGGSSSNPKAKRYADPLGLPSDARRGSSSAH